MTKCLYSLRYLKRGRVRVREKETSKKNRKKERRQTDRETKRKRESDRDVPLKEINPPYVQLSEDIDERRVGKSA